jgi:hypothetical protein
MSLPQTSEYAPHLQGYVSLITEADIVDVLANQKNSTRALLNGISEESSQFRYEATKWSIKELVGHIIDSERVFGYRALRFARNDPSPLPGFHQDAFVANAGYAVLPFADIVEEYQAVREASKLRCT